jgi:serine/threonine protein kinase
VDIRSFKSSESIRFGDDFELDPRSYELRRSGQSLKLERIPTELLLLLVEQRGQLVTRDQIIERIWGKDVFLDTDNSINAAIRKIRQVLKDDPEQPHFVQTITGRGYRFIAPEVTPSPSGEAASPAQSAVTENLIGKKVSHYRVLQLLGGGGMGVVYKAEDLKLGRLVALKFLPSELRSDPVAFERLQREARAASSLDHPNICSIYELGEHEGQPFIVMQMLEGQTVREWVEASANRSYPSRVIELLDLAIQITDGLEAAHQKGIIHRDIKPANVFITSRGQAKILDFGVAKFVDTVELPDAKSTAEGGGATMAESQLTRTGASVGTPSYLSPEQIRRENLDARTDVFSFGLVLYEMATGQRAFSGNTATLIRDDVLNLPVVPARQLNPEIAGELEGIIHKTLEKDRELRYRAAADLGADLKRLKRETELGLVATSGISAKGASADAALAEPARVVSVPRGARRWKVIPLAAVALVALAVGGWWVSSHKAHALTNKDTIVLAEFLNTTGDPVFDGTLRQGLSAQLAQSPFLNLLSDEHIAQTLSLMAQPKDAQLTYKLASEVCQRTASATTIEGSISSLGSQYVLGLKAVNCRNGDLLAEEQVTANRKEQVLKALGDAATKMREKLGESLSSVQKYDVPLENVTTPSLEALNAYSLGLKARHEKGDFDSIPFFRQGVELDPSFAMAYLRLGIEYGNIGEASQEYQNLEQAFALRDRVSTRESFDIASSYYNSVAGDLQKAEEIFQLWAQTYPQDPTPHDRLGNDYLFSGQYPQALETLLEEKGLTQSGFYNYGNLVSAYLNLDRLREARLAIEEARARKLEPVSGYIYLYLIDFLEGNVSGMQADVAWATGKPGVEDVFINMQSDTEAYSGHRREAWTFSQKAVAAARRDNENEAAAIHMANAALREAEFGNSARTMETANSALALTASRDVKILAALAFARAGFAKRAQILADELAKANPSNTILNFYWLPTIRAATELDLNQPSKAIEILRGTGAYELGSPPQLGPSTLYPVYVRGQAYVRLNQARSAAAEFQKLLDHPSCVINFPLGALAHLELGRAYALAGDKTKARTAYQDFLTLWKDADPDIPILKQAKAEYAKLM